jgi:hypothetical protein
MSQETDVTVECSADERADAAILKEEMMEAIGTGTAGDDYWRYVELLQTEPFRSA